MVAAHCFNYLEADSLKLEKEHFPLPVSLQTLVLEGFADPAFSAQGGQAMPRDELIGYIRASDKYELSPLEAVLVQTDLIGDPALPTPEDSAALAWIGAVYKHWESHYPLHDALADPLRKLKPVLALMALADPQFYTPGIHPLHQALDALQEAAVGWQEGLGRAGEPVQKLLEQTVNDALASLEENGAGLMAILRATTESAQRLETRQQRMSKRAADVERGQLRAARAKINAAEMINEEIARFPIPADIGSFLTRPWYESAQLVLLKFGDRSDQWAQFKKTTTALIDSLQPHDGEKPPLESVSAISSGLNQWLLSLQHDEQACEQALSVIEYTHLRVARGEQVERVQTSPIPVSEKARAPGDQTTDLEGIGIGQWFEVDARKGGTLRIQLAMMQEDEQRLLFCNQAGAKVQSLDYASFAQLLEEKKARALLSDTSFSRSLAAVVNIDSQEALTQLTGEALPGQEREENAAQDEPNLAEDIPPLKVESEEPSEPDLPDSGVPDLPMGTWLGFHDMDPPLLAKLALHDKVRRLFIFVNRKGIEQRRLEENEYLELLQSGQIDILETKTNFREQVEKARERMKRHQT
ncbi:MAG: DUF1631 family protein [Halioglobus sp.]